MISKTHCEHASEPKYVKCLYAGVGYYSVGRYAYMIVIINSNDLGPNMAYSLLPYSAGHVGNRKDEARNHAVDGEDVEVAFLGVGRLKTCI